jgi:hypothetical protein
MTFPFEVAYEQILHDVDSYVDTVFSCLESEFLVMPKGAGFVDYQTFEHAYETLKKETGSFADTSLEALTRAVSACPISFIVLRSILGFTPPEWAYVSTQETGTEVTQGFARSFDRKVRMAPLKPLSQKTMASNAISALLGTAATILSGSVRAVEDDKIHRLDKADTRDGASSLQTVATLGVPYAMLLYERFLGRPFAGHRDSVSELVGGGMETAIEDVLAGSGVSYRKTKRAARVAGLDQAPDFVVPDEYNPRVVIEAKITEDDGTARDKVTRVQHL